VSVNPQGTDLPYQSANGDVARWTFGGWAENTGLLSPNGATDQTVTATADLTSLIGNVTLTIPIQIKFANDPAVDGCKNAGAPGNPPVSPTVYGIVYMDGAWDLFHVGHVEVLRKAREKGTYLLVGVHDDLTINRAKGDNHPLMNLHERVLSVLSCKYVDEVVIGAPWCITPEMVDLLHISVVVHGTSDLDTIIPLDGQMPYEELKAKGQFQTVHSPLSISTQSIIERIFAQRAEYEARNRKKEAKELRALQESKLQSPAKKHATGNVNS